MSENRQTSTRTERLLAATATFFSSGRFPIFALSALLFYQIFLIAATFWPPTGSTWGAFAEEFRIRCFQYDPKSGWMQWSLVWTMISEPVLLQVIVAVIWHKSLREMWRQQRRMILPLTASAFALVSVVAGVLLGVGMPAEAKTELPFPGDRIRTQLAMPQFTLTDQTGNRIAIEDYRGQVVLVTAVYSTCTTTCPMILLQIRRILGELSPAERAQLTVIAVSLNPEQDTSELRTQTVEQYYGSAPADIHFVNGVPGEVESLLDKLQIVRSRNPETGQIEHSNMFFVLDRDGRIAYRLSLSQEHESWLISAVRAVLADKPL